MEKALPESCLNCGQVITPEDAYCPNCGQKNRSSKLRLSTFLSDFVEDYFTVDAKFFKSLKRLIFFPGSLTREFNSGKRKTYIAPFRLYIFVSFIFFFLLAIEQKIEGNFESGQLIQIDDGKEQVENAVARLDSLMIAHPNDSLVPSQEVDSLLMAMKELELAEGSGLEIDLGEDTVTTQFESFIEERARRANENPELFVQTIFKASSIAMFIMLPFFGVLLFLFHFRKHKFYVEHLVHSVHFHSFLFVIFLFALIANMITGWDDFTWIFLIAWIYLVLSLRTSYRQSFFKAILKAFLLLPLYSLAMIAGTVLVILGAVITT